ncbi:MAG: arsenosugar biosynthesis radical SAM (seleno)protein ArsS [Planctomycetota bacterium]
MNAKTSLKHQGNPLAQASEQLRILQKPVAGSRFEDRLAESGQMPLTPGEIEILQINLGKMCNMTCAHCHVDAGPDRREIMQQREIDACIAILKKHPSITTVDLTGGAPEMNPHFRELVIAARQLDRHVIDRCNLTILLANGYDDLPEFLAENQVEIVASLPCYLEENTDAQRGSGAYNQSIQALRKLNELGYGHPGSNLTLTLVFNPVGQSLPPDQAQLEAAYRTELQQRFGIVFNRLFTITNMPVSRYLDYLLRIDEYESYMELLTSTFNPAAIDGLMCRNTLSVSWDGRLFDCDFNQMLELPVQTQEVQTVHDFDLTKLSQREICVGQHCFGCTAGSGSSCQGSTIE